MDPAEAGRVQSMMHRGNMAFPLDELRALFRPIFPGVTFNPGWIPVSFAGLPERRYRFVHVDVDLYQPTLDAFAYFFPRLEAGGLIVTDDYNWPGGRKAVDEFCAANGVPRPGSRAPTRRICSARRERRLGGSALLRLPPPWLLLRPDRVGRALDEGLDLLHVVRGQLAGEVRHAAAPSPAP